MDGPESFLVLRGVAACRNELRAHVLPVCVLGDIVVARAELALVVLRLAVPVPATCHQHLVLLFAQVRGEVMQVLQTALHVLVQLFAWRGDR